MRFQAVDRLRICFVTAYPSVLGTASVLIQGSIARSGDTIVVNENMAHGEEAVLVSMRRFATAATNATFRMAGVKLFWREKSPQAFSDSPRGSFQHATYGSRGQHCAVPADHSRSKAVHEGLQTLAAAGVGVVRIWDQTVTQADQYLASRTPYVASKLDCTHFCEPSGVLDEWSDAMLRRCDSPASCNAGWRSVRWSVGGVLVECRGESAECSVQNAAHSAVSPGPPAPPQTPGRGRTHTGTACSRRYIVHVTHDVTQHHRTRDDAVAETVPVYRAIPAYGESYGRHTVHTLPCSDELAAGADTYTYTAVRVCTSSALLEYR